MGVALVTNVSLPIQPKKTKAVLAFHLIANAILPAVIITNKTKCFSFKVGVSYTIERRLTYSAAYKIGTIL